MDILLKCARNYDKLIHTRYKILIGRKGKTILIHLDFNPSHFHHLLGLHKLVDMDIARQNREKVFQNILNQSVTSEDVNKSSYSSKIDGRIEPLTHLESLLDNNDLIFRYNEKLNAFSFIQADFVLTTPINQRDTYLFISQGDDGVYFCRSLFFDSSKEYIRGQTKYTFYYESPQRNSNSSCEIELTPKNIQGLIAHIQSEIEHKQSKEQQRSLMTNELRTVIKERDNYTCCNCGNSTLNEPNLLLEVDHIIPISKGGQTEYSNLQTLCWRCNRSKSDKIF